MATEVSVTRLHEDIYIASRPLPDGPEVRSALILGERRAAVIDTLCCPADMAAFVNLLATHNRPVLVVNTHADWDHAWGNAAFPDAEVVGHRLCRARLLSEVEQHVLHEKRREDPTLFAPVTLRAPDVTFDQRLDVDLGGLTLQLHYLPGHTPDCLVAYVPERRLLFAGDCAEDPFPLLNSGPLSLWAADLSAWARRAIDTVVPSHGRVSGVELLLDNACYLHALETDAPLPVDAPPFYKQAHAENRAQARRLAALPGGADMDLLGRA